MGSLREAAGNRDWRGRLGLAHSRLGSVQISSYELSRFAAALNQALFWDGLPADVLICESAACALTVRLRMDTVDNAITKPARRLEVFTGAGRRRTWSDEDKARVVAEIESSGDSVSGVARRHGLSPQQLFGWRRQVREAEAVISKDNEVRFVPAVLDA